MGVIYEDFDLRNSHWEKGVCRVCGKPMNPTAAQAPHNGHFCSTRCRVAFNTAIRRAYRVTQDLSVFGISKCEHCGRFYPVDGETLCPVCRGKDLSKPVPPSKKESHKPEPVHVRMCHECKKRKAAPGSYWCARCKQRRNEKYHIRSDAWESGEDHLYGMYSDGRRITSRGSE